MNAATYLLAYAGMLTWGAPAVLHRMTVAGGNPRFGAAAWLAALGAALGAWASATVILLVGVSRHALVGSALTFCVNTLGAVGHLGLPRLVASSVVATMITALLATSAVTLRRVRRQIGRARHRAREHAEAARLLGRPFGDSATVVVTAERPTAYCVGGPSSTIVITSAALERLDEAHLAAVLAHERAHLRGGHHRVLMALNALSVALPRLPLFARAPGAVATLLEMSADDAAARGHGRDALLAGMVTLSEPPPAQAGSLAAAGTAVLARASRLAVPPTARARWRERAALSCAVGVTALAPAFAVLLCAH